MLEPTTTTSGEVAVLNCRPTPERRRANEDTAVDIMAGWVGRKKPVGGQHVGVVEYAGRRTKKGVGKALV